MSTVFANANNVVLTVFAGQSVPPEVQLKSYEEIDDEEIGFLTLPTVSFISTVPAYVLQPPAIQLQSYEEIDDEEIGFLTLPTVSFISTVPAYVLQPPTVQLINFEDVRVSVDFTPVQIWN